MVKAIKYSKKQERILEEKANTIKYMVQDMLDNISQKVPIDLDSFEKAVLIVLKHKWSLKRNWDRK